jgi:acyl-CoA synthetase (NDP forming)
MPKGEKRASLAPIFTPKSVAVVGASPTSQWGKQALENFASLKFPGQVAAINPKYPEISGFPCYPSLRDMPFVPESVLIGVNRDRVVSVMEEAAEVGARGAVIFAIGFAEAGEEGAAAQRRIRAVAAAAGMAVIGPNCQGTINFHHPCAMYMGRVHPYEPGHVGLFAQSGSVTTVLTNNTRGVRWSHIASCGNEAVSDSADLIGYYVDDPQTHVICGFIETIRDAEHFFYQCDRARAVGKPVIIMKSGRTEAGRKAATAHSGALSAPDRLYDELFRRHTVLRVDSTEELLETAIALQSKRRPAGGRVAAITASGGQIELILDETGKYPNVLSHPELERHTQAFLREILPSFLATSNPLDYWGVADFVAAYPRLLGALADDANIDIVVGVADPTHYPTGSEGGLERVLGNASDLAARSPKLITLMTETDGAAPADAVERMLEQDVLLLSGFAEGFRALERLVTWSREQPPPAHAIELDAGAIERYLDQFGTEPISGAAALELLRLAGIPVVATATARSVDEAVAAAERLGYPVVVKIGDAGVAHKTEANGVVLNIGHAARAGQAARDILGTGATTLLVQTQVENGLELIVGLQRDPTLGTFVLVGQGGIWTEVLNDVAIRPVELRQGEAGDMLRELRSYRLLEGARGASPVDLRALEEVVHRLDELGRIAGARLEAIDINPLFASPRGVVAVDALVVPRSVQQ